MPAGGWERKEIVLKGVVTKRQRGSRIHTRRRLGEGETPVPEVAGDSRARGIDRGIDTRREVGVHM